MAQENPREEQTVDEKEASFRPRLLAIPVLYYTPETKLAFGAGGVFTFRAGKDKAKTRPTSFWMLLVYTLNKQFQAMLKPQIYSIRNIYFISGTVLFEKFPQKFWGVGPDSLESAEETYTPQTILFQVALQRKISGYLYGGIEYKLDRTSILKRQTGGILDQGDLTGSQGGLISGLALSLTWDSRDNILFPRRGQYLQFSSAVHNKVLGSSFNFSRTTFDLRAFFPIRERHVIGLRAYMNSCAGTPPFYQLSLLGGETLLRGYYKGRFRDKNILVVQAEYRLPLGKRFGLVGFAGLGDVAARFSDFKLLHWKYTIGAGIRFKLDVQEGTNLRLDVALGKESFGFYITATESF